jgi:hypothetical protein
MYDYPDWGFSVLFSQLQGKCQGDARKDGARPALFLIFCCSKNFCVALCIFCVVLCIFCVVLCDACFVTFPVLFVCICVLNNCHRVATQLQLNISYRILYVFHHVKHKYRESTTYRRMLLSYYSSSLTTYFALVFSASCRFQWGYRHSVQTSFVLVQCNELRNI